jgi:hypothetical protein
LTIPRRHPCTTVDASAANILAIAGHRQQRGAPAPTAGEPALWVTYLAREVACGRQRGAVDCGTDIIAVVRRT